MRPCFQFFWVYTQSGIAGSYNSSIFNFGGNCYTVFLGFPDNFGGKEYACNAGDIGDSGSIPELGRSPGGGNGKSLIFLPRKFHGQRSLADYSSWGHKESDTTDELTVRTHTHTDSICM